MIFLKKNLKSLETIDTIILRDRIDSLLNSLLPSKLLKKKKSVLTTGNSKNILLSEEN
jgi:hypothetical protein